MAWGKIDDTLYDHPKVHALGRRKFQAVGLHTLAISWCNRYLTDGAVSSDQVRRFGATPQLAGELVAVGLWERAEGGYRIHDYLEFNDSREEIEARREEEREKKRLQRLKGSKGGDRDPSNGRYSKVSPGDKEGVSPGDKEGVSPGDKRGVSPGESPGDTSYVSPATRPVPSRPVPDSQKVPSAPSRGARDRGNRSEPRLTKEQLDAWSLFTAPEWQPFRAAWLDRGFRLPPSGSARDDDTSHRGLLWSIADARPNDLGRWVREAPGRTPHDVVSHVLDQWHGLRNDVDQAESQLNLTTSGVDEAESRAPDQGATRLNQGHLTRRGSMVRIGAISNDSDASISNGPERDQ